MASKGPHRCRGLTLLELNITILLLGILFAAVFRLHTAQKKALQVAKENTLAMFVLEGQRNRLLDHFDQGKAYDEALFRGLFDVIPLPWKLTGKVLKKTVQTENPATNREIIVLSLEVPPRLDSPGKKYLREVEISP